MSNQQTIVALSDEETLRVMADAGNFEIIPRSDEINFGHGFTKLGLSPDMKMHINSLIQQIPSVVAAGTLAQSYIVKFPEGLPKALTQLHQGGFGTMIQEHGRFVGSASLYSAAIQAAFLGVFTAMSIASGQYFLSLINSELKVMKLNIDKILEFLYGEKKAELMAEVSFVKYAYLNYSSIMEHSAQRAATIGSLQNAKKIAMKDIEFYITDLDSTVNGKDNSDVIVLVNKVFQIKESLELSIQLYGISSVLETYFSRNHDRQYVTYIEGEITSYIDKCEKRMLSSFSVLSRRISDYKGKLWEKLDKTSYEKSVNDLVDSLNSGEESAIRKVLRSVLQATNQVTEYYVSKDGDVYLKAS